MSDRDTTGGQYGPSWWDVERAHESIEKEFDCQVAYSITYSGKAKGGNGAWWIRAGAYTPRRINVEARAWGAYGFRGNSGAKTLSAAMHMALLHLRCKLEEKEEGAKQASMF